MAIGRRISLRAHEGSIRRWASEGRDDAWIAGALGTSPGSIQSFRSRRGIPRVRPDRRPGRRPSGAPPGPSYEGAVERDADGRVGLWFDPAVADDARYGEAWTRRTSVVVRLSAGRIVLEGRRPARGDGGVAPIVGPE